MKPLILLVDDNAIQSATRKAIVERAGCTVIAAQNGHAALEILSDPELPQAIGLMITDHLMPGLRGPELVREVRRRGFDIPVIVLSGLPDAELDYTALDAAFRLKPFPPESLIGLIRELLHHSMPRTA